MKKLQQAFHVHTWRCKHAGDHKDEEYIEKAIDIGASEIVFTDHAPFPGDPFGNRMDMDQLPEYIDSMNGHKKRYAGHIEIKCGLEAEYLPGYIGYYKDLQENPGMDILILGQHFFEHTPGKYSFSDEDKSEEYIGLGEAILEGINSGYFDVVAHPDRIFRRRKHMEEKERDMAARIINAATSKGIFLELNYESSHRKNLLKPEFWKMLLPDTKIIYGLDAHSPSELEEGMQERDIFEILGPGFVL